MACRLRCKGVAYLIESVRSRIIGTLELRVLTAAAVARSSRFDLTVSLSWVVLCGPVIRACIRSQGPRS